MGLWLDQEGGVLRILFLKKETNPSRKAMGVGVAVKTHPTHKNTKCMQQNTSRSVGSAKAHWEGGAAHLTARICI